MSPESRIELEQLRMAEEIARTGCYALDQETGEYTWTLGMYRLLELDPSSPSTFAAYRELIPAEDMPEWERQAQVRLNGDSPYVREYRLLIGPSKREMWIRARAQHLVTEDGRRMMIGVILDITESHHAKEEIAELNRQLLVAVERQADVIEVLDAARHFTVPPSPGELPESITCPRCKRTTHHPGDVAQGYCPGCHDWTSLPRVAP